MVLRKSFYIHWSAGRSPRVHKVNPGRDPSISLDLNSLGAGSRTILCPGCGMFVWPMMVVCVDCFFGHLLCHNWS